MIPPVIFDTGDDGTWLDMLANSPCLDARDYPSSNIGDVFDSTSAARTAHERTASGPAASESTIQHNREIDRA